ncbi:unnamed protein product [Caenorhabditis bovis]|uniref:Doublecortin domain-containing protein n=1 Tax=Caenorhabditis bovis TaxID=2654633 RepID=A0A8S1EY06_9PELO|nr:unnamed protein product [Caenorhabditis bovis]
MPTAKKKTKKMATTEDPLSSSGVSSLSGISSFDIRKITIFKNGDRFHRGVKYVINPRVIKDMEPLLNQLNERIELSHGVKRIYTKDGKLVKGIKELEDGKIYVAASSAFIPMRYGEFEERVWMPPSRKHSPIFNDDRLRTARTRSQEPRKTAAAVTRSRSVRAVVAPRHEAAKRPPPSKVSIENGKKAMRNATKAAAPKAKPPPTPKKKAPTAGNANQPAASASRASIASSVMPNPVASGQAEIIEFPEEAKVVNVETIHKTPTPPTSPPPKRAPTPKSVSEVHSEEEKNASEEEEASGSEEAGEEEESDEEGAESSEAESVEADSDVETPSSRKSSSAVSSQGDDSENEEKKATS